jgi:hypothetical protein
MRTLYLALAAVMIIAATSPIGAQSPDPTGHWEGTISLPTGQTSTFAVDLVADGHGRLGGTIDLPDEQIRGLPLQSVEVDGTVVTLVARSDQPMTGTLSADGRSFTGALSIEGVDVPVTMTRTGDAHVTRSRPSHPIDDALQGTWNGTLAGSAPIHVVLTLSNGAAGSRGTLVNLDEGGLTIPLSAISERGSDVTLELDSVGGSFTGELSHDGARLAGTYTEHRHATTITFTRAAAR